MTAEVSGQTKAGHGDAVAALEPVLTRVVRARLGSHPAVEDLVQEALARVLASAHRVEEGQLEAYAVRTVRNLIATMWRDGARFERYQPRLVEPDDPTRPDDDVLAGEDREGMRAALQRLTPEEQALVVAHEVDGVPIAELAQERGSTPGAVGAQLHRVRARLRVEYLVAESRTEPPTERCRPVLAALAGRDRRRQREAGVEDHLLRCAYCRSVGRPLIERAEADSSRITIEVSRDKDVVVARQEVRRLAAEIGFDRVDLTLIATAVSEIARNIVKFAGSGMITAEPAGDHGIRIVARDDGPGIPDVAQAMTDGYSTYGGLGLGLPGVRRIMDDFHIRSVADGGTTITMARFRKDDS